MCANRDEGAARVSDDIEFAELLVDCMKIEYDPIHDLLNIEFVSEQPIAESVELDGIIIDYSENRRIVAIEILDAGKRTTKDPLDLINLAIVKEKVAA